ncbi:hypothetical protein LJ737_19825 [Hymenobacter sp. 15J16-1T3B]|uniref:hypothetical protein n=1 Tax=Hymenobacter sp. 15J16-1T3B TaxID=2886941 RepID=UPI001D10525F|nr:hypothetical protein [Hymenobacter sp. 15J16-1T3B]MCC3159501.1 hypothetical protein [Hymenobacter sp. 15J16-1T3B]
MSTREKNTQKRHERIRAEFKKRYTDAPRPRKYSREYVVAQLADEFGYSMGTIENIIYAASKGADTSTKPA